MIISVQCANTCCNKVIDFSVKIPSEIHWRTIECNNCGSIIRIDLSKIDLTKPPLDNSTTRNEINTIYEDTMHFDNLTLLRATLGKYSLGSFCPSSELLSLINDSDGAHINSNEFADSLSQMKRMMKTIDWQTNEEVENYITMVHEGFHFYQDLYLGFTNYLEICQDQANLDFILSLSHYSKNHFVEYPFDDFGIIGTTNAYNRAFLLEQIQRMGTQQREFRFLSSVETTRRWIDSLNFHLPEKYLLLMQTINASTLLECQAAIGTEKAIDKLRFDFHLTERANNLLNKHQNIFRAKNLPPKYTSPLYLLMEVLPDFGGSDDCEYLTLILCDIALHIPPPTTISELTKFGIQKRYFNPGIRFIKSLSILQNLDDEDMRKVVNAENLSKVFMVFDNIINDKLGTPNRLDTINLWQTELSERIAFWNDRLSLKSDNMRFFYRKKALNYLIDNPALILKLNPPYFGGPDGIPMIIQGKHTMIMTAPSIRQDQGVNMLLGMEYAKALKEDLQIREAIKFLSQAIYNSTSMKCPWLNICEASVNHCNSGAYIEKIPFSPKCIINDCLNFFDINRKNFHRTNLKERG
jgi:hypothetical protein